MALQYNNDPITPEHIEDEIPFAVCTHGVPQIVYGRWGQPLNFSPRNIAFVTSKEFNTDIFFRIDNLVEYLQPFQKISVQRTYALGDVIMCIPLMRHLRRKYPEKYFALLTIPEFHPLFNGEQEFAIGTIFRGQSRNCSGDEINVNLDFNTFEIDHSLTHPWSKKHRTDILFDLFSVPKEEREYDYSIEISEDTQHHVKQRLEQFGLKEDEFLFWSWRGSNPIKTFPIHIRQHLIKVVAAHIPIVVADWESNPEGRFDHPNVWWYGGENILNAITCMGFSKGVVTTDSAVLWFAHQTNKPVACYLGPTLEEQRLVHHPGYGEGLCRKIELKDLVGCPQACQHQLNWCRDNGHRVFCFEGTSQERLGEMTVETLKQMGLI